LAPVIGAVLAGDLGPGGAPHNARQSTDRLGGTSTIDARGTNAFGFPLPLLDRAERRAFAVGNSFFRDNWVIAPGSAAGRDGLGPLFNARSCSACHFDDGRGRPPLDASERATGFVVRLGERDRPDRPHATYGRQLQDDAIPGVLPEASFRLEPQFLSGSYADGAHYELMRWHIEIESPGYGSLSDVRMGARVAQQLIGTGLLEAVEIEVLQAASDPLDADDDGISGRIAMVRDPVSGERTVGRFGWKAAQSDLRSQIAAALREDMGITSPIHPAEGLTPAQAQSIQYFRDAQGGPEIDDLKLIRLVHYTRALAVPAQRNPDDPDVVRGRDLFSLLRCDACHAPTLRTGSRSPLPALREVVFHPYTDLLLHDMGTGLADDLEEGDATGREWRTAPLWGIGLIPVVNGHSRYLHDGRARSLEEAILWHGGEADRSRSAFQALPGKDREALIAFLQSL